jgi:hypothetical protein
MYDENNNPITSNADKTGIRLILKRSENHSYVVKSCILTEIFDNYSNNYNNNKISSSTGQNFTTPKYERPKRMAAEKAKLNFLQNGEIRVKEPAEPISKTSASIKRTKSTPVGSSVKNKISKLYADDENHSNEPQFFKPEEVIKNDKEKYVISKPDVLVFHSLPLMVASIENGNNAVHTVGGFYLHLYRSYFSPCILCVQCKKFFSTTDFVKHFHFKEDELSTDSEYGDEVNDLDKILARKLANRRKKSYKILPYKKDEKSKEIQLELNKEQLETWKKFQERHAQFASSKLVQNSSTKADQPDRQKQLKDEKDSSKKKKFKRKYSNLDDSTDDEEGDENKENINLNSTVSSSAYKQFIKLKINNSISNSSKKIVASFAEPNLSEEEEENY